MDYTWLPGAYWVMELCQPLWPYTIWMRWKYSGKKKTHSFSLRFTFSGDNDVNRFYHSLTHSHLSHFHLLHNTLDKFDEGRSMAVSVSSRSLSLSLSTACIFYEILRSFKFASIVDLCVAIAVSYKLYMLFIHAMERRQHFVCRI